MLLTLRKSLSLDVEMFAEVSGHRCIDSRLRKKYRLDVLQTLVRTRNAWTHGALSSEEDPIMDC